MAKSFNSILVGLAIADGHIRSVLDPVEKYVPELKNSGYGGTTIKDLLEMRSGVEWDDNFFAEGSTARKAHVAAWVEGSARYTDFAAGAKRAHPPGTVFQLRHDGCRGRRAGGRARGQDADQPLSK